MKTARCKRCGASGLSWAGTPEKFGGLGAYLTRYNDPTSIHPCHQHIADRYNGNNIAATAATTAAIESLSAAATATAPIVTAPVVQEPSSAVAQAIAVLEEALSKPTIDPATIAKLNSDVDTLYAMVQAITDRSPLEIAVRRDEQTPPINLGIQHKQFPLLLAYVSAGCNVYLPGPAGSGKTTAARKVAEALGMEFRSIVVSAQTSKSDLVGYCNAATGEYVRSAIRDTIEFGGVCLIDEIDSGNGGILTAINQGIDTRPGDTIGFPDGMVKRHPDAIFIAAGNTLGYGADARYVGRNRLDGASLSRFVFLFWDYDWNLTADMTGDLDWSLFVGRVTDAVNDLSLDYTIGPRQAIDGAKLLRKGIDRTDVETVTIWARMSADDGAKIRARLGA